MLTRMRPIFMLALAGLFLVSCQSMVAEPPTDQEALQDAVNALLAYERGDCTTASHLTNARELAAWEATEIRHSMLLLNGFCKELDGDLGAARAIYDRLIEEEPASFAAQDAKERSRIIRINESDPSHASWMRNARARAMSAESNKSERVPLQRQPAVFPPLAQLSSVGGYAVIEFGVTPTGQTTDPVIIESAPPLLFDGTAVRAIRRWEYAPRRANSGNDVQVIRLLFQSDDSKPAMTESGTTESGTTESGTTEPESTNETGESEGDR